uniref:Ribosomal RNA adenine dimethylase domain containing 1 n=1 Tax=Sinocyclocheilus anshuiensis TaxID=1608454 RepID=A0A671RM43_9TELE
QIADLLLDKETAHALLFPRKAPGGHSQDTGAAVPEEFQLSQSQSSLLGHIFRKHVKPKKQHEIRQLGTLVKKLCDQANCKCVVDVGSGQGHLTWFLSFGLGLDVTGIEADPNLVSMATKFDRQLLLTLTKENQKTMFLKSFFILFFFILFVMWWAGSTQRLHGIATESDSIGATTGSIEKKQQVEELHLEPHSYQTKAEELQNALQTQKTAINTLDSVTQINNWVFPSGMTTEMLTCKTVPVNDCGAKQPGSFVLTGLHACGDLSSTLLRHFANCPHVQVITSVACCYMKISTKENPNPPGLFQPPFSSDTVADSCSEYGYPMSDWVRGLPGHQLSYKFYHRYARLAWLRVGLPADLPFDPVSVDAMLAHQGKVVAYFSLVLLLAPVERGTLSFQSKLIPLSDAAFSPRNLVLVAVKPKEAQS